MSDRTITLTERQVRMLREAIDCYDGEGGPLQGWLDPADYPAPDEWIALDAMLAIDEDRHTEPLGDVLKAMLDEARS